ncbi:MAG TPA: sigma-70 family RNA polymerase sigma factor [Candidatus Limnocylindria bacterium]|nr:sigma-70 family RNA polymerase sigma factor [Candidatus Limnocylindria bacterium]
MAADEHDPLPLAVARAVEGDELAFARIVKAHHEAMLRVAMVICRDADLAKEAVQIAWGAAWRQLRRLREPERLRSWLVAIAANEARGLMRRSRRREVVELNLRQPGGGTGDTTLWVQGLDLRNALGRLSPDDRALLALRYVGGLDSFELSRVTGLSPSGTRARLARLLATLRTELHDA